MEAFHLLSRGGVNFDKQRFKSDVKLFSVRLNPSQLVALAQNQQGSSHIDAKGKEGKRLKDGELPPELDFFKYAMAGPSKRKPSGLGGEGHARTKRHRNDESVDGSDASAEDEADGNSSITTKSSDISGMPRQRVTVKGNNAPRRADTFKELHDRYHIHSQLMDNLKRYDYEHPTGIQSAGCPILLEVSSFDCIRQHRLDGCSLAIWLLYPQLAQERHCPTFCQFLLSSSLRCQALRRMQGKACAQLFWLQHGSWHIKSITNA